MPSGPLVRMLGIRRTFGSLVANDAVDLDLRAGEVHALLGENGAGKSTLMNVLAGYLRPDAGSIEIAGKPVHFRDPRSALRSGIGMVHQHFQLVPTMTVAANILLNDEPVRGATLDEAAASRRVRELSSRFGLHVDPAVRVRDASVAAQQKVEILKVLRGDVRVLILDEPTAVLSPQEVDDLFRFLRALANGGTAIVLITHKLSEALAIADHVTILRGGRVVATRSPTGLVPHDLAKLMVGRDVLLEIRRTAREPGPSVLRLEGIRAMDDRGLEALRGVDLECRAGEIVGIAGVDGNGQRELVEVATGLRPVSGGAVFWEGRRIDIRSVAEQIARGIGYIPEDRRQRGLILGMDLSENLILRRFRDAPFARGLRLRRQAITDHARRILDGSGVRARPDQPARSLSGGNQQKVVVGRELASAPRLLVASQPTRGVDVGAMQSIYDELLAVRGSGAAVLLVSFDLDELLPLSDRVAVMYRGEIVATYAASEVTPELLGLDMTGARSAGGAAPDA